MKAIVLAAGYAMRLYPLTKDRPKALLEIGGRHMLDYLMDEIASVPEIDEAILVTNSRFYRQFCDWAAGRKNLGLSVRVLDDGTDTNENRLGAIGDMQFALDQTDIDDDVLVAAADNLFTFRLNDFVGSFRLSGKDTLLAQAMGDTEELKRFAIATLDEKGRVVGLVEKPQNPPTDIAVYALYLYRRDTLPLVRQYIAEGNNCDAPGHFPEWLYKRRDVRAYLFEGDCVDIGTPEAYAAARAEYEKRR
jgi:glucose-1-phosphate thymidylyltransferase